MAIQISGNTVITNARKGQFQVMNVGAFASDPTAAQQAALLLVICIGIQLTTNSKFTMGVLGHNGY